MDIEAILNEISSALNKPVDELKDSNIDEVFHEETDEKIGNVAVIEPFIEYIHEHLPEKYAIEVENQTVRYDVIVKIYLEKTLDWIDKPMEEGLLVEHRNSLTVGLASLDPVRAFSREQEFRKIGDILEKIKLAYDAIEKYQAEHLE